MKATKKRTTANSQPQGTLIAKLAQWRRENELEMPELFAPVGKLKTSQLPGALDAARFNVEQSYKNAEKALFRLWEVEHEQARRAGTRKA